MKDLKELSKLFEIHGFLQGLEENSCSCCKEGIKKAGFSLHNFLRINYHELTDHDQKTELDSFKERLIEYIKERMEETKNIDDGNHGSFHRLVAYNSVILWINAYQ